jgi:hypothetical protein
MVSINRSPSYLRCIHRPCPPVLHTWNTKAFTTRRTDIRPRHHWTRLTYLPGRHLGWDTPKLLLHHIYANAMHSPFTQLSQYGAMHSTASVNVQGDYHQLLNRLANYPDLAMGFMLSDFKTLSKIDLSQVMSLSRLASQARQTNQLH